MSASVNRQYVTLTGDGVVTAHFPQTHRLRNICHQKRGVPVCVEGIEQLYTYTQHTHIHTYTVTAEPNLFHLNHLPCHQGLVTTGDTGDSHA